VPGHDVFETVHAVIWVVLLAFLVLCGPRMIVG
jgi:hypothetical protein